MAPRQTEFDQSSGHASARPSKVERGGGNFTIPAGLVCTIIEMECTTWGAAGESAIKKGRQREDPALRVTVTVEDRDEPMTEFLSNGKGLTPSDDGEFFDGKGGWPEGSNAEFFVATACDPKRHGKRAFDEELLDNGQSAMVGLKFVSGRELIPRENLEGGGGKRPSLCVAEIVELPGEKKVGSKGRTAAAPAPAPSRRSTTPPPASNASDNGFEEMAESGVTGLLDEPKWRQGLPLASVFNAVHTKYRGHDDKKSIMAFIQDKDWVTSDDRPWALNEDGDTIIKL